MYTNKGQTIRIPGGGIQKLFGIRMLFLQEDQERFGKQLIGY
jgi:hypothetical protein